jgi:hypothetical protein
MSYSVRYSAKQASWYVQVDGTSDDYGTSLYDTEQEAYAELAQMVSEGLITQEEIGSREEQPLCGCGGRHFVHTDEDEEIR